MNYSINLKVMRTLTDSKRGQLTTEQDRKGQINGSHEEISSVYELIFRTNIRLLVRKGRDKILILPLRGAL